MSRGLYLLLCACLVVFLLGILMPAGGIQHFRPRPAARTAACRSNLKQLAGALRLYAEDADGRLPPVAVWSDAVRSNLPEPSDSYAADIARVLTCPGDNVGTGNSYAMNEALSGLALVKASDPTAIVLLFESNLHVPNAAGSAKDLAVPERHPSSPGNRNNNFAFLDGHVKWSEDPPPFGPRPQVGRKQRPNRD